MMTRTEILMLILKVEVATYFGQAVTISFCGHFLGKPEFNL